MHPLDGDAGEIEHPLVHRAEASRSEPTRDVEVGDVQLTHAGARTERTGHGAARPIKTTHVTPDTLTRHLVERVEGYDTGIRPQLICNTFII